MVKLIESKEAFQEALAAAGDKLVVVDFSATWCGPCKMIKPFFHSLCDKYSNVVFLEVDVDDCQATGLERPVWYGAPGPRGRMRECFYLPWDRKKLANGVAAKVLVSLGSALS